MAELVGTIATRLLAPSGEKFRVTWNLVTIPFFGIPLADAPSQAIRIQKLLPSLGFAPVSNPSSVLGDRVIVFDVRPSSVWGGKTVGEAMNKLQNPITSLSLARMEALSLSLSSGELTAGQAGAVDKGNKEQEEKNLWAQFQAFLKDLLGNVATGVGVVVGIVVVGGITYWYVTKRRQ